MITQGEFSLYLITSTQYFYEKRMGARWENLYFGIRVKGLTIVSRRLGVDIMNFSLIKFQYTFLYMTQTEADFNT